MTTTASTFYNKIDVSYPKAGKDNDSQTFRDNFTNIKSALESTDGELESLRSGLVRSDANNDFGFNTISRANFKNCSTEIYTDATTRSQSVIVNYINGSYQKFNVSSGLTNFRVSNWPEGSKLGSVIISIKPDTASPAAVINFPDATPVGETILPFTFSSATESFFEVWYEGSSNQTFVTQLGYKSGVVATGNDIVAFNSVRIATNLYTTGSNYSTVVTVNNESDNKIGRLAVLRDIYTSTVAETSFIVGTTTATNFNVAPGLRIFPGATFLFTGTNTTYTVDSVVTQDGITTVTTLEPFEVSPSPVFSTGDLITFVNPVFDEESLAITFKPRTVNTTTGVFGDVKGEIYANSQSLYISYTDHGTVSKNWIKVDSEEVIDAKITSGVASGSGITRSVSTNSDLLATTAFVHDILPYGSIIMWYGSTSNVPTGWALCDGTNSTPDLRDRFVIGASTGTTTTVTGSPIQSGGSKDAVVVSHSHSITGTANTAGSHVHTLSNVQGALGAGFGYGASNDNTAVIVNSTDAAGSHSHTLTGTADTTGVSGTNANLPPYYALCFIMKITGQ